MRYLSAIILPPLAVFLCGKPIQLKAMQTAIRESEKFIVQLRAE